MEPIKERKCNSCGHIKGFSAFRKNKKSTGGRNNICNVCMDRRRTDRVGISFEDASKRPGRPVISDKKGRKTDLAWHIARERQQDLLRRDVPYYPSNAVVFAPVGGWNDQLRGVS